MSELRSTVPRGLRYMLVGSIVLHMGAAVGLIAVQNMRFERAHIAPQVMMVTKLVRLGKKRTENLLPRLVAPAPAAAPKVVPSKAKAVTTKPKVKPEPTPRRDAKDLIREMSGVRSALSRIRKVADEPEGDPSGVAGGEVSQAVLTTMQNKLANELYSCAIKHFAVQGMARSKVAGLATDILVQVNPDGKLSAPRVQESSGNPTYDSYAVRAMRLCKKVSPPPKALRETLRRDGFLLNFKAIN